MHQKQGFRRLTSVLEDVSRLVNEVSVLCVLPLLGLFLLTASPLRPGGRDRENIITQSG